MFTRRYLISATPGLLLTACTAPDPGQDVIEVSAPPGSAIGELRFEGLRYRCTLGRAGIVSDKQEGDGGTPAGLFPLRQIYYRPDRLPPPQTSLPVTALSEADGWCDAPDDPAYNKHVTLPYPASAEALWRQDGAYDVFAVIGYNDAPIRSGAGSAIFLHVMRSSGEAPFPTAGCVALARDDLLELLARIRPDTLIGIG